MPRWPRTLALSAVLTALLACSLTGGTPPTSSPPAPVGPSPTVQPSPTPDPLDFPSDFETVLTAEVDAGTISYEDGLIRLLRAFLGDGDAGLPDDYTTVRNPEGTGIVERANDYLASGADDTAKAEIQRLLDTLIPTTEQLEYYSQPASSSLRPPGLSRPNARPASQTDCAGLWRAGFPLEGVTRYLCFEYTVGSVPGIGAYTIYYPASWGHDDPGRAKLEATATATQDALSAYGPYGDVGTINIIFSLLPSPSGFLAEVNSRHARGDESCPILIFPSALGLDEGPFQQTIAHELFHCYQLRNLADQMMGTERPVRKWWSESSAEYFSNVVYDDVDFEHRNQPDFDHNSAAAPLTQMGYENAVFFQYLARRVGDAEVIQFLRLMPTSGGEDAQIRALADYTDMKTIFHEFARAYLDANIQDRSGSGFPVSPEAGDPVQFPASSGTILAAEPFVIQRHLVNFEPDLLYTLTTTASGADGDHSLRIGMGESAWGPVPEVINASCPQPPKTLLLTNATPGLGTYEVQIQAETEDAEGECDPCLFGTWELDLESYRTAFEFIKSSFTTEGTIDSVGGGVQMFFFEDGRITSNFAGLTARGTFPIGDETGIFQLTMSGTSQAIFIVEGPGRLTTIRPEETFNILYHVEVGGRTVDVPAPPIPPPTAVSGTYTCTSDSLHITPIDIDVPHPGLDYTRVR
jgi:hypothetical protein